MERTNVPHSRFFAWTWNGVEWSKMWPFKDFFMIIYFFKYNIRYFNIWIIKFHDNGKKYKTNYSWSNLYYAQKYIIWKEIHKWGKYYWKNLHKLTGPFERLTSITLKYFSSSKYSPFLLPTVKEWSSPMVS